MRLWRVLRKGTDTATINVKRISVPRPFRSNVKEQKLIKAKFTFSVNQKPIALFKMEPRTKVNYHPVNYTPQSDFRIQQSLEIFQNMAKINLQIATAISHFFNNHQAAWSHSPHVQSSTKDRSHDLPQQMSHTSVYHASPYEHVEPNSRHLTPDTLHQPLSPPTPQVQNQDPESADPPLSAVWSLPRFCRSSQERVDHLPAVDRSRSFLFSRQVPRVTSQQLDRLQTKPAHRQDQTHGKSKIAQDMNTQKTTCVPFEALMILIPTLHPQSPTRRSHGQCAEILSKNISPTPRNQAQALTTTYQIFKAPAQTLKANNHSREDFGLTPMK